MKRITWHKGFLTFLILCVLSALLVISGCSKKEPREIRIGAVLPLTGSAAVWGQNAKMGLEIALEEVNAAGGPQGKKVKIIYEDSQSEPTKAVSALQKLISTDRVPVVIGDIASS